MSEPRDTEIADRLRRLPRETAPPAEVEERLVRALRAEGLLRSAAARRRWPPAGWQLAAAALVGLLGGWLGHAQLGASLMPPAEGLAYLLLLSEPQPLRTDKPTAALVAEYRAWAERLAAEGRLVNAARLEDEGRRLRGGAAAGPAVGEEPDPESATGFFVVTADSLDQAVAIAATCPHLGYGGEISVRPVARGSSAEG